MVATILAVPNPVPVASVVAVTGSGFGSRLTRLRLDGVLVGENFRAAKGTFTVGVLVSATPKSQSLVAEQKQPGGSWSVVARLAPLLTFAPPVADTTAPVIVGTAQAIQITSTSFVVSWTTNEPSTSVVNYGLTAAYGSTASSSALVTTHQVQLTGLTAATLYHFRVQSADASGNNVVSGDSTQTTFGGGTTDTTAPVITGPTASNITTSTVTISWSLDEYATGQVQYGTTTAYGQFSVKETSFAYNAHAQTLTGLTAGTTYHYRVISTDASGNTATSADFTFSTTNAVGGFPPDRPALTAVTRPTIPALPGYLVQSTDPTWGTQIIRVSNTDGRRHAYSKIAAWNCDGTKLLLPFNTPYAMLDGVSYTQLRTFGTLVGNAIWSNTDPNKMWGNYSGDNNLYYQNMTTDAQTSRHTFGGYTEVSVGDSEGAISGNDQYIALLTKNGATNGILVYDTVNDVIVSSRSYGASRPDNCQMSRGGNYVLVQWGSDGTASNQGFWVHNRGLTTDRQLNPIGRHFDSGYDANGNEIAVVCSPETVSYNLASGAGTQLLPNDNAFEYGHVSMRAINRPGWVYLSSYSYTDTSGRAGRDQLVAVKTDGSGIVEVFGFTNHLGDGSDYEAQPQASVSPDGKRMIAAIDWGTTTGPVYAMVFGLDVLP